MDRRQEGLPARRSPWAKAPFVTWVSTPRRLKCARKHKPTKRRVSTWRARPCSGLSRWNGDQQLAAKQMLASSSTLDELAAHLL